jgi:hypothetical protein
MKFNRLGAFTLGVVITAVSVGAVSFVNAAGNGTLKACANKTSGAMRYISKGSCKKTETSLSWNQMGPQGLPGSAGTNGTAGTKGDTGAAGEKGSAGADGLNLYAVNAEGKTLGPAVSADNDTVTVLIDGQLWVLNTQSAYVTTPLIMGVYFKDASCSIPLGMGSRDDVGFKPNQTLGLFYGTQTTYNSAVKIYKKTGIGLTFTSQANVYQLGGTCSALSSAQKISRDSDGSLWELSEILTRPDFSWPVSVVAK